MAQPSEDSTSGNSASRKKSLPAIIGGAVLVLVAGYFGIDLSSNGSGDSGSSNVESSAAVGSENVSADSETCAISSLPDEAAETRDDIVAGGPYDYPENDNRHFGNYEGILPDESSDFYREYTVETLGLDHRGARRIITGGGSETDPEVWYYTDDHYESFCEIPDAE
ncbi:MAG: ribonuclease domain-containing protein [Corynebacterium sp.]|uniref:ribonuclease domain-containing protein n=1 Tax=Corynebacterium casei TaxID=160386 RepID=UPI003FD3A067